MTDCRAIRRHAVTGPDYETTELRVTPKIRLTERYKLNLGGVVFNLLNRDNQRVAITRMAVVARSTSFVQSSVTAGVIRVE